uniref:Uncharacterized protein n=1 Tax=Aegilops tauschii subsp. strangulata TaxID=200361 RepID=A0A453JGT2_AEGTS
GGRVPQGAAHPGRLSRDRKPHHILGSSVPTIVICHRHNKRNNDCRDTSQMLCALPWPPHTKPRSKSEWCVLSESVHRTPVYMCYLDAVLWGAHVYRSSFALIRE